MAKRASRKTFVNLAVRDLKKSKEFFTKLGFEFDPQFSDDNAACMIISEDAYSMLLREDFFKTFTKKSVCDTTKSTEVLIALSCESKAEVDELLKKALAAGGTIAMDPQEHAFMYYRTFHDLDGHHWEIFWMDPAHAQQQ